MNSWMETEGPARISSPCVKICAVRGDTGLCMGCGRTLKEIGEWSRYTETHRLQVMAGLGARLEAAEAACTDR